MRANGNARAKGLHDIVIGIGYVSASTFSNGRVQSASLPGSLYLYVVVAFLVELEKVA